MSVGLKMIVSYLDESKLVFKGWTWLLHLCMFMFVTIP